MKYVNTGVVFQEIPDEVTLSINISNCPCHCLGCHSEYLWRDIGEPLNVMSLGEMLKQYGDDITCVAFMGGDSDPDEVARWAEYVRPLKTAWYSGRPSYPNNQSNQIIPNTQNPFDYIKLGPYIESLGGLKSPNTNQHLYKRVGDEWQDITSSFWKKNL